MKTNYIIIGIGIILLILFFGGCVQKIPGKNYEILSKIRYNKALCSHISYNKNLKGFNTGLRIILKNKNTGKILKGYAIYSVKGNNGYLSTGKTYTCEEQINSQEAIVSAYSDGYAPIVFELNLSKNQLATIGVNMMKTNYVMKSCSGGPSCSDEIREELLESVNDNETKAKEIITHRENYFFDEILTDFGLEKSDYNLSCMECSIGRGSYIKAKGIYKNSTPFELYYRHGMCSSGGADCGWDMCFSSRGHIFDMIKNKFCDEIVSGGGNVNYTTAQVRKECFNGKFERTIGNQKSISIIQNHHAYHGIGVSSYSVAAGNPDCFKNN